MTAAAPVDDEELLPPPGEAGSIDPQIDEAVAAESPGGAGDPKALIEPPAAAPGAGVPGAVDSAIVPPVPEGPPEPNAATDAILAKLPPGAAPAVPAGPGGVAPAQGAGIDAAGNPDPSAPPAPPSPEGVVVKQKALEQSKAEDALLNADAERKAQMVHQKEQEEAIAHGNAKLSQSQKTYDDRLSEYQGMGIKGYYEQPHHSRLMAAIAIALGGIGAGLSAAGGGSSENRVLTQINKNISDDYERQKFQIDKARDSVVMARTGINDAKEAKAALLEDAAAKKTATFDGIEKEARQQLAERGMSQPQIDADSRILQIQAMRKQAQIDADKRQHQEALDAAREHLMGSQANRADQQAALAAKKAKGGSGAGAGGGKQQALTEALTKSGGEITPEVAAVADKLKIKPTDLRGMASSFKQERRVDLADRKVTNNEVETFAKDNGLNEIVKRNQALTKINGLLSNKDVDPLTQVLALQEFDKASKGGTATASAMQTALSHLAGGTDKIDQFIEKVKDGGLSQAQLSTLRTSVNAAAERNKAEGDGVHEAFNQTFRNMDSYPDQKAIDRLADSHFGSLGYSRKAAGGGASQAAAPSANPQLAGAQAWLADPKNANSPLRGAVQAKVQALQGAP